MGNALRKETDPFETTWDQYLIKLEEFRRHRVEKVEDRNKWLEKLKGRLAAEKENLPK